MSNNNMKIRKCLFPAAGYGTRFLPATKAIPKEMLPVLTKPLLQYGVEEAISADIETMATNKESKNGITIDAALLIPARTTITLAKTIKKYPIFLSCIYETFNFESVFDLLVVVNNLKYL
jgi:CTP:molybdopterin cytidylyltransferase MocA